MKKLLLLTVLSVQFIIIGCEKKRTEYVYRDRDPGYQVKVNYLAGILPAVEVNDEKKVLVFKDPNFGSCVKDSYRYDEEGNRIYSDTNKDGVISLEEASKITDINCFGQKVDSMLGIEVFENLESLNCSANTMGAMPRFSGLTKLKSLRCVNNYFSDADCSELSKVRQMDLSVLEIEKQADGRVLSCDQVRLIGHIGAAVKGRKQFSKDNTVNDVWGFTHKQFDTEIGQDIEHEYLVYGDSTKIYIVQISDKEPYYEKVVTMSRGAEGAALWTDPDHSGWSEFRYYYHEDKKKAYLYASSEGVRNLINKAEEVEDIEEKKKLLPLLTIYDVTDINKPIKIKLENPDLRLYSAHNITLDVENGHLITFGGTQHFGEFDNERGRFPDWQGGGFFDISKNPEQPEFIAQVGSLYVHDGQIKTETIDGVKRSRLYLAEGSGKIHWEASEHDEEKNRVSIYDVTDLEVFKDSGTEAGKAAIREKHLLNKQYSHGYAHNIWVTDDNTHIVVTGETSVFNQLSYWQLVEIKNDAGELTGKYDIDSRGGLNQQGGSLAHNAFIQGNYIYMSHYSKGAHIAERCATSDGKESIQLVWAYDTYQHHNSSKMEGSWGIFPFSSDKNMFASTDTSYGLFIFKKTAPFYSAKFAKLNPCRAKR